MISIVIANTKYNENPKCENSAVLIKTHNKTNSKQEKKATNDIVFQ